MLNQFSKYQLVALHFIIWIGFAFLLSQLGIMQFPNEHNLIQWDAGWYHGIVKDGYWYAENAQCNVAFFPMFPLLWKLSGFSTIAISVFNIMCFIAGIFILSKAYNFNNQEFLIALSFPSLFFCFIPYSEALFFLSVSILLLGFSKQSKQLIFLGLLLTGLCRSTSMLFFPAFLFIELPTFYSENNYKKAAVNILQYTAIALLSILIVAAIQFYYTGRWFDFLFVQKFWNKAWQLPKLPLTTWGGSRLLWLDGVAFLFGLGAMMMVGWYMLSLYKRRQIITDKSILFSLAYLITVSLITLLYSVTGEHTSIYSINRYIIATPFFVVFIVFISRNFNRKVFINYYLLLMVFAALLFGLAHYIIEFNNLALEGIGIFSAYAVFNLFLIMKIKSTRYAIVCYVLNTALQLKLMDWFLSGEWVG